MAGDTLYRDIFGTRQFSASQTASLSYWTNESPFNTYSKRVLTLSSLHLQPVRLAPDHPTAVDLSGWRRG